MFGLTPCDSSLSPLIAPLTVFERLGILPPCIPLLAGATGLLSTWPRVIFSCAMGFLLSSAYALRRWPSFDGAARPCLWPVRLLCLSPAFCAWACAGIVCFPSVPPIGRVACLMRSCVGPSLKSTLLRLPTSASAAWPLGSDAPCGSGHGAAYSFGGCGSAPASRFAGFSPSPSGCHGVSSYHLVRLRVVVRRLTLLRDARATFCAKIAFRFALPPFFLPAAIFFFVAFPKLPRVPLRFILAVAFCIQCFAMSILQSGDADLQARRGELLIFDVRLRLGLFRLRLGWSVGSAPIDEVEVIALAQHLPRVL